MWSIVKYGGTDLCMSNSGIHTIFSPRVSNRAVNVAIHVIIRALPSRM